MCGGGGGGGVGGGERAKTVKHGMNLIPAISLIRLFLPFLIKPCYK